MLNLKTMIRMTVSCTSPSRVHTQNHPLHKKGLHKDCDLIYTDLEDRNSLFGNAQVCERHKRLCFDISDFDNTTKRYTVY